MICMVVLQNCMDIVEGETGNCSGTGVVLLSCVYVPLSFPFAAGLGVASFSWSFWVPVSCVDSIFAKNCAYTSSISAFVADTCSSLISVDMDTLLE
jgi:hypothetical protein